MSPRYLSFFAGLFAAASLSALMSCGNKSERSGVNNRGLQESNSGRSEQTEEEGTSGSETTEEEVSGSSGGIQYEIPVEEPKEDTRAKLCDDAGNCSCDIRIASLGRLASYGSGNDDTNAWKEWLNSKSTAKVELITKRPTITAEFLQPYDLIILQALEDREGASWTFTQSEADALEEWVRAGGGIIALTGYGAQTSEVEPSNQLLKFAHLAFNKDDTLAQCPASTPCYCWGNSIPLTSWEPEHPISKNLSAVGAYHGHSVEAGEGTEIVASDGNKVYAAYSKVGDGKVFAFGDEWVVYTSQWQGVPNGQRGSGDGGLPPEYWDPHNPCHDADTGTPRIASKVFQVPQFWYNAIKHTARSTECEFTIDEPDITILR